MVGSWTHRFNVNGIEWFLERVWPRILAKHADTRFRIVGSGMTAAMSRAWGVVKGVEPVGFVDNLAQVYRDCMFTVAPLFEGGGTKIKVLESLRYGRTTVVTSHAQRGYESTLRHDKALLVADDEQAMADACVALLQNPCRRQALADEGERVVSKRFGFERFSAVVQETLERVRAFEPEQSRTSG